MKYPCNLIRDLIPLYIDGVCGEESKIAIENHLEECSACKEYYTAMREADAMEIDMYSAERECQKAASFQNVKKKLLRKQMMIAVAAVAAWLVVVLLAICILKTNADVVEYEDNISVSMVDGNLIGRLQGSRISQMTCKRVTITIEGREKNYLFFYMVDTKWDEVTIGFDVFSECTLCYADKGADQIDAVYYYTGEYTDMEIMDNEELQEIINASVILWENKG